MNDGSFGRESTDGALDLLTSLGFSFGINWEDELEVAWPDEEDMIDRLTGLLEHEQFVEWATYELKQQARENMRQCVGGPNNGQRIGYHRPGDGLWFHVEYAKWSVYVVGNDGLRANFIGMETSEKKAKSLARKFWADRESERMQTGAKKADFMPRRSKS